MFTVQEILISAVIAGLLVTGVLAAWPWARQTRTFLVAGATTVVGFTAWNMVLHVTNTPTLNVDAPVIGLSWQDAGSGIVVFTATQLVLGLLTLRGEAAGRVVCVSAIAGCVAMIFDIFVL